MQSNSKKTPRHIAIIGGGLAGLSTAYHILREQPDIRLVVYEAGSEQSYTSADDHSGRASLGASAARVIRYTGARDELDQWLVRKTTGMLRELGADAQRSGQKPEKLFYPEASVTVVRDPKSTKYTETIDSLKRAGADYSEVRGSDLKRRFPGLYRAIPDNAYAVVEEPASARREVAGVMDTQATLAALRRYITARGGAIRYGSEIKTIGSVGGKAVVQSDAAREVYDKVIVATGARLGALVDESRYGISRITERVAVMDIDLRAAGVEMKTIPFSRGDVPKGAEGSLYSASPNSADGRVKFLPKILQKVMPVEALHQPLREEEKNQALAAAGMRLNMNPESLRPHVRWSSCVYTLPAKGENPLVAKLDDTLMVHALDSSSSARRIGGLSKIAAAMALGLKEPFAGAYERFGMAAHRRVLEGKPACPDEAMQASRDASPGWLARLWHGFLTLVGFEEKQPRQAEPLAQVSLSAEAPAVVTETENEPARHTARLRTHAAAPQGMTR
jgi:glycine/D-amino acid oxidase-like deaminating enzyme